MGSIVELRVDNCTEDTGYSLIELCSPYSRYVNGCRLDPSLTEEDRWILAGEYWTETVAYLRVGNDSDKFFTLTHGNELWFSLWGENDEADD